MLDKKKIAQHFSRSAKNYDQHAILQHKIIQEILIQLASRSLPEKMKNILDVGCGTGSLAAELAKKYPEAQVIGADLSSGMIEVARFKHRQPNVKYEIADAEALPYENSFFDLVVSSSTLQWTDLPLVLKQVFRVLSAGGVFMFSTFGPHTLKELKEAFQIQKDQKWIPVNAFSSLADLEVALKAANFDGIKLSSTIYAQKYETVRDILWSLKETGAQYSGQPQGLGLGGKNRLQKVLKFYAERFGNTATYEVVYAAAIKG